MFISSCLILESLITTPRKWTYFSSFLLTLPLSGDKIGLKQVHFWILFKFLFIGGIILKKTKKILSVFLAAIMVLSALPLSVTASAETILYSGYCGDNAHFTFNTEGILRIYGTGPMGYFSSFNSDMLPPWYSYSSQIKEIVIEEGITATGHQSFYLGKYSSLISVKFPESLERIDYMCFSGCSALTSITIPNNVKEICDFAFRSCSSLASVNIPEGITYIGKRAFWDCVSLGSIVLPESVSVIREEAFRKCAGLSSIYIGKNIKTIETYAFLYCSSLKDVYYGGTEEEWTSINIYAGNDYLKNANIHFNSGTTKEETVFIKEHTDFVTTNKQYANLFVSNSFYENIWLYEEDSEGKKIVSGSIWEYLGDFDELVSFKIDGLTIAANPYDLIFFDLINSYNTVESYKEIGLTK